MTDTDLFLKAVGYALTARKWRRKAYLYGADRFFTSNPSRQAECQLKARRAENKVIDIANLIIRALDNAQNSR